MKAIEFNSKIKDNKILIPLKIQAAFADRKGKSVRVIVLIDEDEKIEEKHFKDAAASRFFEGYADIDAIYDK
jgi:hypothetical protein